MDVLVRSAAGDAAWDALDDALRAGRITLREALRREAQLVRLSKPEALAVLASRATIDPEFAPFVRSARAHRASVSVVSCGVRGLIIPALARAGVEVPVYANDVGFEPQGWRMTFIDDSDNGHDKAARVLTAAAAGARTVYIGDGISDFAAVLVADVRFAKRSRALERYCRERGVACTSFDSFDEIDRALFAAVDLAG